MGLAERVSLCVFVGEPSLTHPPRIAFFLLGMALAATACDQAKPVGSSNESKMMWLEDLNGSEWFHSRYSRSHWDIDRVLDEQWLIGSHIYRTKDLMGYRI